MYLEFPSLRELHPEMAGVTQVKALQCSSQVLYVFIFVTLCGPVVSSTGVHGFVILAIESRSETKQRHPETAGVDG